jgi:hypothetical protein
MNRDKWWNDRQIKKEEWSNARLTNYILSNENSTWEQIKKRRDKDPAKTMKTIKRVLMQMHQRARDKHTNRRER